MGVDLRDHHFAPGLYPGGGCDRCCGAAARCGAKGEENEHEGGVGGGLDEGILFERPVQGPVADVKGLVADVRERRATINPNPSFLTHKPQAP